MPKTITKTVYTFQELLDAHKTKQVTAAAVDKARSWLIEGVHHFDWWDYTYETWTTALEQIGFMQPDISFSGFSSQGDGASFTCKGGVDKNTLIEFLTADIKPSETVTGEPENFRPWIVHNIHGKPNPDPRWIDLLTFDLDLNIARISHQYSHKRTCTFNADWDGGHQLDAIDAAETARMELLLTSLRDAGEQLRLDLCDAIYKDLREEYEYRVADAQLIEDSDANDYTFDVNGRRDG